MGNETKCPFLGQWGEECLYEECELFSEEEDRCSLRRDSIDRSLNMLRLYLIREIRKPKKKRRRY